jgi:phage-related baseplate assembly protein
MTFVRHSIVDLSQLPAFSVVQLPDAEARIRERMLEVKRLWEEYDPPLGALYDVENLEFDPIKIEQEVATNFELNVLTRINLAAKAVTMAYASGTDIDVLASRYPGGVPRLPVETYAEGDTPIEKMQKDARYKRRVLLIPNTLSPHGVDEAYAYYALTGFPEARDASVVSTPGDPNVIITVMTGPPYPGPTTGLAVVGNTLAHKMPVIDPRPSQAQILATQEYVGSEDRRSTTDVVQVIPPRVTKTRYVLDVWLFPGPDESMVLVEQAKALIALAGDQFWLGHDHTHMAILKAAAQPGVQNVKILEPATDLKVDPMSVVVVTDVVLRIKGRAE